MIWELEHSKAANAVASKLEKGATEDEARELYPQYFDAPELSFADAWFYEAFCDLSTCVRADGGPIPWDVVRLYASTAGYPRPQELWWIISAADLVVLKRNKKKAQERSKQSRGQNPAQGLKRAKIRNKSWPT